MDKKFRGDKDLEIIIEQKDNEILTLNNIINLKQEKIDALRKQINRLEKEAKEILLFP
jgi:polyhydroxyalkanoate synthesis regulator phasin